MAIINPEPQRSTHQVKSLNASSTGINHKHSVPCRITHDLQNMRMTADEHIRPMLFYKPPRLCIVSSGISSDMSHEHLQASAIKHSVQRVDESEFVVVAVSSDSFQGSEPSDFLRQIHAPAEISCMPYLIDRLEKSLEFIAEHSVSIRYQTYIHNIKL